MAQARSLEAAMQEALAARGLRPAAATAPTLAPKDDFAGALAAPQSPDHYQIAVPADFERDAALETKAREWFHRAGLPQGAVNGIVEAYCRQICCDPATSRGNAGTQAQAELMRDWGSDYPRKIAAAQALIAKCGGAEELAEILGSTGLGDDAWLIRTLAAIAEIDPQAGAQR